MISSLESHERRCPFNIDGLLKLTRKCSIDCKDRRWKLRLTDKVGGDRVDGEVGEGHLLVFVVERQVKVIADFCRVQVDSAVEHQVVIDQDASPAVESMIRYLIWLLNHSLFAGTAPRSIRAWLLAWVRYFMSRARFKLKFSIEIASCGSTINREHIDLIDWTSSTAAFRYKNT